MRRNESDVFDYLRSDPDTPAIDDYLTYAMFAFEKQEWIALRTQEGSPPTQQEIEDWIANLTEHRFNRLRQDAVNFFDEAARNYLGREMEEAQEAALRSAIVREVKAASAFWKQFALALVTAILAPIILGGLIWGGLVLTNLVPTPADVAESLMSESDEPPPTGPAQTTVTGPAPRSPPTVSARPRPEGSLDRSRTQTKDGSDAVPLPGRTEESGAS